MKVRQILVMDDKEIDLEQLSKEEQKQVEARLNAAALRQAGYEPSPRRKDSEIFVQRLWYNHERVLYQ